jgi:hypothetical protein
MAKILTVVALAVALLATAPTPASAVIRGENVKVCLRDRAWTISAGMNPPKFKRTSCRFARIAWKVFKNKMADEDGIPVLFRIRIRDSILRGVALQIRPILRVSLTDRQHYVFFSRPY